VADFVVIMRGWDPAGLVYVYWESTGFDSSGADYVGPPAFGTLIGVTAVKQEAVSVPPGFSAWLPISDTTQEVAQLTEDAAQFSDESELREVATLEGPGHGTMDQPAVSTKDHPSTSQESELRDVPTDYQSGQGSISPAPLHQFEAI